MPICLVVILYYYVCSEHPRENLPVCFEGKMPMRKKNFLKLFQRRFVVCL